jgi:hypothetical protein
MPVFWVVRYTIREGQRGNWFEFLASPETKQLWEELAKEAGMKHLHEYRIVSETGPQEYESWSELPDMAALEHVYKSPVLAALMKRSAMMTDVAGSSAHIYEPIP